MMDLYYFITANADVQPPGGMNLHSFPEKVPEMQVRWPRLGQTPSEQTGGLRISGRLPVLRLDSKHMCGDLARDMQIALNG